MSDPCPNTVLETAPEWAARVSVRGALSALVARMAAVEAEAVLLPLLVAALATASFLVLAALHTV